ncbi:MAG: permease-like cell division protein FtsX [Bacteroidota bacterium]
MGRKPNYVYSVVSVSLVLFLLGLFGLLLLYAQQLVKSYKESVNILIEMNEGSSRIQALELEKALKGAAYTKPGSIQFTSKEEAAKLLQEELGEEFLQLDFQNPLYDLITFNVKAESMSQLQLGDIRRELKEDASVHDVYFQEDIIEDVEANIQKLGWLALGIGILFLFVAIVLIHNTIRLALFANRFLIKNMQLVGASWGFISRPYLGRSFFNGLLSAALSIGALLGLMYLSQQDMPELRSLQDNVQLALLFGLLLLIGIVINIGSTFFVVNKYLKMRVDDLY